MNIYENRKTLKKQVLCRICGHEGHLWMTCTVPQQQLDLAAQGKEPNPELYSDWYGRTYKKRDSNGKLIYRNHMLTASRRYVQQQRDRKRRLQRRREHREQYGGKKTVTKHCGFCGEKGHNRRNCTVMKNFVSDLGQASANFRKHFYKKIIEDLGIAEGALVAVSGEHVRINNRWERELNAVGIVQKIQWDKVNLGLVMDNWDYRSRLQISILVNGETVVTECAFASLAKDNEEIGQFSSGYTSNWGLRIDSVLAPSENPPDESWFNNEYTECWEWLVKKRDLATLGRAFSPLIAKWHPSIRGRNAKKLKARLSEYDAHWS